MRPPRRFSWSRKFVLLFTVFMIGIHQSRAQDPPGVLQADSPSAVGTNFELPSEAVRERLRSIGRVYLATLDVMHDRYFHGQRAMVPARAMEDVFAEIESQLDIRAQWIAVNAKAMSVNHEPKTEFEKEAAAAISQGKSEWESTIEGNYFLAVPVSLTSNCINCHVGMFREPSKKKIFAGLILSTPLTKRPKP